MAILYEFNGTVPPTTSHVFVLGAEGTYYISQTNSNVSLLGNVFSPIGYLTTFYDDTLNVPFTVFSETVGQEHSCTLEQVGGGSSNYTLIISDEPIGPPDPPDPPVYYSGIPTVPSYVYELDKGWSFDGAYIPHYLELNWLFNEDPFTYHEMQKVRIHGLTKGNVDLQVAMSGMQGDATTDYLEDYTEPQFIDLPFTPIHISEDFLPSTNYTDVVSRGMGIQMKFEGRNTDVTLPEPAHAIQVLALQASPQGNGKRAN